MTNTKNKLTEGVLKILILKIINSENTYGYNLIKTMNEKSKGYFNLSESYVYPFLQKMEKKGLIGSYLNIHDKEDIVPKKYYKITEKGKEVLQIEIQEWEKFIIGMKEILNY